jgi:glycosyltransferase involved in cell wall biosynthesis
MNKVSVILPVYNAEIYVKEAIESILSQTYYNFELIIINDGSTDNSETIINSFNDQRIKYIKHLINKGLIFSLNEGIRISTGDYIARMDADDISLKNRFQEQINFFEQHKSIDICGTSFYQMNKRKRKIIMPSSNEDIKVKILFGSPICHPSVMIRKRVFLENKDYYNNNFPGMEDYKLWIDLLLDYRFHNLKKPLLKYRIINTGITQQSEKKYNDRMELHKRIYNDIFHKVGFKVNDKDIYLHGLIQNNHAIKNEFYNDIIIDYIEYAKKLKIQNKSIKYCSSRKLSKILCYNLIRLAIYNKNRIKINTLFNLIKGICIILF